MAQILLDPSQEELTEYAQNWRVDMDQARRWYHHVKTNTHFAQGVFFPYPHAELGPGVMLCLSSGISASQGKRNGMRCI